MGTTGGLQIWPKLQSESYQDLHDSEATWKHAPPPSTNSTIATHILRKDSSSTLQSYYDAARFPLAVSQQTSASAVRDMALRKGKPTIHAAAGQPELLFPKQKESKKRRFSKKLARSAPTDSTDTEPVPPIPFQLAHPTTHATLFPSRQESSISSHSQSSKATVFDQNMYDNAKINRRRPPKGIQHWFEGLDDSSDDDHCYPEVVEAPTPATVSTSAFHPALGPARSRGSPTAKISPLTEPTSDYFEKQRKHDRFTNNIPPVEMDARNSRMIAREQRLKETSVLSLSSSEDETSEPHAVPIWTGESGALDGGSENPLMELYEQSDKGLLLPQRGDPMRASTASAKTTTTSGSITIINGNDVPVIDPSLLHGAPLPLKARASTASKSPIPEPSRTLHSQAHDARRVSARQRASTLQSIQSASDSSINYPAEHVMTVTEEEMILLEMMRRKRAAMAQQSFKEGYHMGLRQEKSSPRTSHTINRSDTVKSGVSSVTSNNDFRIPHSGFRLDSPDGTVFPNPPASAAPRPRAQGMIRKGSYASTTQSQQLTEADEPDFVAPSPSPRATDPEPTEFYHGPNDLLPSPPASIKASGTDSLRPALVARRSRSSQALAKTPSAPLQPVTHAADPYQLAPDLVFSPLDLLPLPPVASTSSPSVNTARTTATYSPSLSTSRTSPVTSTFSQSGIATPDRERSRGRSSGIHDAGPRVEIVGGSGLGIAHDSCEIEDSGTGRRSSEIVAHEKILVQDEYAEQKGGKAKAVDHVKEGLRGAGVKRGTSMGSMSSTANDVLAAWSALGGRSDPVAR
ncbi:hypothetical protein H2203_008871 [Taxawa tesnikishii (nom. ined.)]|nr:hypothetical protein H2203_008871 [Dothideales sp. JES 119]